MRTKTPKSKTILTKIVAIVILALLVIAAVKCANGASLANTAWSLLPPVIAIVLALITKEAYSALFIGVLVGGLFTCGFAPVATLDTILNDGLIAAIAANAGIFLFLVLLYRFICLRRICYRVGNEQLVCERGLFCRRVDYMELYRIVDFQEHQSLLQQLCGLKTVVILSTDRNSPKLDLIGIRRGNDIVAIIRERVEINKRKKGIYEITNH